MLEKIIAPLLGLILVCTAAVAQDVPVRTLDELDTRIAAIIAKNAVPGMSVAVVEEGEIVLAKGYGLADVAGNRPVTAETLFKAGSTSKNLTSLLALILAEEGAVDLNAPLSRLLPDVAIDNPYNADHPIRLVHLLEHTAGIEGSTYNEYATSRPGASPTDYAIEMGPKLKVRWAPGFYFSYSNPGHTLAAAAMERATGESFDSLMVSRILGPLGMDASSFLRSEIDASRLSDSYGPDGVKPQPHWDMTIRPSGGLITTASDLAQVLKLYLNRGAPLLSSASIERMEAPATSAAAKAGLVPGGYGLGSFGYFEGSYLFQGHWGATEGFRTHMGYYAPADGGYVVMANADEGTSHQVRALIGNYLTRSLPTPTPSSIDAVQIDPSRHIGWYRPFTEEMRMRTWLFGTLGAVRLDVQEGNLVLDPVVPIGDMTVLEPSGGATWRYENVGVPTVALVEGPDGSPVLVDGSAYNKVGWFKAVVPFYILVVSILASLVLTLFAGIRILLSFFGVAQKGAAANGALLIGAGAFAATVAIFVQVGLLGDWHGVTAMGRISVASLSLLLVSVVGPIAIVLGIVWGSQRGLWFGTSTGMLVALGWFMLALNGWVPLRTFLA